MKKFRIITSVCLAAIAFLILINGWYLHGLYNSLKSRTMQTVAECVRKADILNILHTIKANDQSADDSFIRLSLLVEGEPAGDGTYAYPDILDNFNQTISKSFHIADQRDAVDNTGATLDSIFRNELDNAGLHPERAFICHFGQKNENSSDLWSVDFAISDHQTPIYTAYVSPLHGYILKQMAGIIISSGGILLLTGFLIWYLLHRIGRLRSIEQMKDDFTHNMTHELKTPVAVAYSAADSMLRYYDQSDEARNRRFLKIIMQRLSFLSGMIENILSMSMQRFKTIELIIDRILLKPFVQEVADMIILKAEKPVEISINMADNLLISADQLHLGNLLSNLLDNAVKYSGDTVNISISADSNGISVSDDGIGIDKDHIKYIFDKFYRVTTGDRYETRGYGLGLFYVKEIATLHGWKITVESRLGKGSVFTLKFNHDEER